MGPKRCSKSFRVAIAHLTGSEDNSVIVLRAMVFMIIQLLSPKTHSDRAECFVHSQIVPVLYKREKKTQQQQRITNTVHITAIIKKMTVLYYF